MQKLESELKTVREKEMADIREKINSILTAAGHGGAVELAATSTRLDTKFNDVRRQIIDNCTKFRQGGENLSSHRGVISQFAKLRIYTISFSFCSSFNAMLQICK